MTKGASSEATIVGLIHLGLTDIVMIPNAEPLPPVRHTSHQGRVTRLRSGLGIG